MNFTELLDVPFTWGGKDKATGLDCYGLAREARAIIFPDSRPLPDYGSICQHYTRDKFPKDALGALFAASRRAVRVHEPTLGDLALILGPRGPAIATYLGDFEGCERVLAFGSGEKPELLPIAAVRPLSYWRVKE